MFQKFKIFDVKEQYLLPYEVGSQEKPKKLRVFDQNKKGFFFKYKGKNNINPFKAVLTIIMIFGFLTETVGLLRSCHYYRLL